METELLAAEPPAALLERATKGNAEAFAELVRQHQRMVFSIAWHFFHDATHAEDLAQDVFLQLFQSLREIRSESHLVFWLRQVATRKCIDHARRLQRQGEPPLDLEAAALITAEAPPADRGEVEELRRLVAGLPAKFRAVVTLRYQEDMPPSEVARVLGCPINSVKSRLQRALALLRQRMKPLGGTDGPPDHDAGAGDE
jgi:RNA polymerase sigma-70 factor (ECF subfamily)